VANGGNMTVFDVAAVGRRLGEVRQRIAAAGGTDVTIVAVTKGFGTEAVEAAIAVGLDDIGENYAQELLAKLAPLGADRPRVHFIGRLQSNKVRSLAQAVDLWQSIDRISLVEPLAALDPPPRVLVQVNVTDEPQKGGCAPEEVTALVARLCERGVVVEGLMAVGRTGSPDEARPGFRLLRELADDHGLAIRSMGMTDDLEVAVEEGSTMVRVGSALFGPRPIRSARAN
jgi:pyridoxal phosphate enzyme (YggS family)